MEVRAELKNLRVSPRKVRLVSGLLRGMDVARARFQLDVVVKKSSRPLTKLLDSAVANATNNFNLEESNLFIKDMNVDEGPKLKRFRPKGFGRTSPIEKKTSHVRIILGEKIAGLKGKKTKVSIKQHATEFKQELPGTNVDEPMETISDTMEDQKVFRKFDTKKSTPKKEVGRRSVLPNFKNVRRLFRRKAV